VRKGPICLHFLQFLLSAMAKLLISFERRNIQVEGRHWLFRRAWLMRFEWIALMAYKRVSAPADQAWVRLDEVARLPSWGAKTRHHTSTNLGRYLQSPELAKFSLVTARTKWSGPYRLKTDALSVRFDLSLSEVRNQLGLRQQPASAAKRAALLQFTYRFARAHWLFFHGRLERRGREDTSSDNAYELLMRMTEDRRYSPTLQLLALLSAMDVLFRLGRYRAARQTLVAYRHRLQRVADSSLRARLHLKLAWTLQRSSSGKRTDRAVEIALREANFYALNSGDRATLGLLAHRTALYYTKKGLHSDAINQLIVALEADLITGNYDNVQAACGDLGSIIHRLGPKHYDEARRWLLLSIAIARMMNLGRDDAHAEMILGKIYVEQGRRNRSRLMLERARHIAEHAGNRVNLADIKMVWGFWYERFGTRKQLIETLRSALNGFRTMLEFDVRQKEQYMERSFPLVWQEVASSSEPRRDGRRRPV
jgi:hypothetical protein